MRVQVRRAYALPPTSIAETHKGVAAAQHAFPFDVSYVVASERGLSAIAQRLDQNRQNPTVLIGTWLLCVGFPWPAMVGHQTTG